MNSAFSTSGVATLDTTISRMTAVKYTASTTPMARPFWATISATSPRVIMPTPTLRESPQLKRQSFAARPQPMILVISATMTKQMQNSRISGVRPLILVFRPMDAKKMGAKMI